VVVDLRWWLRFLAGFAVLYGALAVLAELDATGRFGLLILAAVLGTGLVVERVLDGTAPAAAARRLGLGRPGGRAVLLAAVLSMLVLLVHPLVAALTGAAPVLRPGWPWLLVGIFAFHGVAEELVWRGYAFRRLRAERSFGRAVAWTMPLVAATHIPIVLGSGTAVGAAAMLVAAVTSLPLAYLFETGRNTIWAPALVHTAIDSFKLVEVPTSALTTFSLTFAAVALIVPLLALAVPRRLLAGRAPAASTPTPRWRAVRWPVLALLGAGLLLALADHLDTGPEAARDAALLIGAPTLYLLLPGATVWLVVAFLVDVRRRRVQCGGPVAAAGPPGSPAP
jgi:membrane protease YdiL (CAAX protease family)